MNEFVQALPWIATPVVVYIVFTAISDNRKDRETNPSYKAPSHAMVREFVLGQNATEGSYGYLRGVVAFLKNKKVRVFSYENEEWVHVNDYSIRDFAGLRIAGRVVQIVSRCGRESIYSNMSDVAIEAEKLLMLNDNPFSKFAQEISRIRRMDGLLFESNEIEIWTDEVATEGNVFRYSRHTSVDVEKSGSIQSVQFGQTYNTGTHYSESTRDNREASVTFADLNWGFTVAIDPDEYGEAKAASKVVKARVKSMKS